MKILSEYFYIGLRAKLLFAIIIFSLVPLIILGTLISENSRGIVIETTVYLQNMRASVLAKDIDIFINSNVHRSIRSVSKDQRIYTMSRAKQIEKLNSVRIDTKYHSEDPFWNLYLRDQNGVNILDSGESPETQLEWKSMISQLQHDSQVLYREFIEDRDFISSNRYEKCRFITEIFSKEDSQDKLYFSGIARLDIEYIIFDDLTKLDILDMPILVLDKEGSQIYSRNLLESPNTSFISRKFQRLVSEDLWIEDLIGSQVYYFFGAPIAQFNEETNLEWVVFVALSKDDIASLINIPKQTLLLISGASLLFLFGMGVLLTAKVIKPIRQIIDGAKEIREGNFDKRIKTSTRDELQKLAEGYNKMAEAIQVHVLKYKKQTKKLDRRVTELKILHDLGKSMNSILELDRLLNMAIICVVSGLKFDRAVLLLVDETGKYLTPRSTIKSLESEIKDLKIPIEEDGGVFARCVMRGEEILVTNVENDKRIKEIDLFMKNRSFFATPLLANDEVIGIFVVDNAITNAPLTVETVSALSTFSNSAALAINNASLYKSLSEKERLEQELKIGNQIQTGLIPTDFPTVSGLLVVGKMIPAREIGGDYFDIIPPENGSRLGIAIGDVAGKGVPAGLIMVMARSIVRSIAGKGQSAKQILIEVNRLLTKDMEEFRFMTMVYMDWIPETQSICFSSAGHEEILIYRSGKKCCESIKARGVAIGLADRLGIMDKLDSFLEEHEIKINPNDAVILYTDGVTEAVNEKGDMYRRNRLIESIVRFGELDATEMLNQMLADLKQYMGNAPQYDDITMVVVKKIKD